MNISKHFIILTFFALLFKTEVKAQLKISFGDNPQSVLSVVKYLTNQINASNGEVSAYYKVRYEGGSAVEIIFVKKNLTNLYGTLTHHFTARERLIFSNNKLSKKLVEIPEKSLSEVKKAIGNSNQFNFIDDYIFSLNYESVYSIFLNSDKIVTVQSLPTNSQKIPAKVQKEIDNIFLGKNKTEELDIDQKAKEDYGKTLITTVISKEAEFQGGEDALSSYISNEIKIPQDTKDWHGKVLVEILVYKTGELTNIKVENDYLNDKVLPLSLENEIIKVFKSMPKWNPALTSEGNATTTYQRVPLNF